MDSSSVNIRQLAFEKLAALEATSPNSAEKISLNGLLEDYQEPLSQTNGFLDGVFKGHAPVSRVPMTMRELEILLALCKTSSSVSHLDHASRLITQLSGYLPESHSQLFQSSPFLFTIKPSPWEQLTRSLASALLTLGSIHLSLREIATDSVTKYLAYCARTVDAIASRTTDHQNTRAELAEDPRYASEISAVAVSLVGLLESVALNADFWTAEEKLSLVKQIQSILSEEFLVTVEAASSSIRNSSVADDAMRDWKRFSRRYAAESRPLGAMLLQQAFIHFVKACAITTTLGSQRSDENSLWDESVAGKIFVRSYDDAEVALADALARVVTDGMQLLEDGSDYLQLGASWQQWLAFSVKASALVAFLNCTIIDEESADSELLFSWLEEVLSDPIQMSNDELAMATLRATSVLARLLPASASMMSRSVLRFIVQGGTTIPIISIAAKCLAQIVAILSQDAIITTLYSIGNVLSQSVNREAVIGGSGDGPENGGNGDVDEGLIVFSANEEDRTIVAYRNVIHAIVVIAASCNDEKITALAQSMLLQKIGKINTAVDAYIIQETAHLALSNSPTEFGLLLKFYARIHQDSVASGKIALVDAVQAAQTSLSISLERGSTLHGVYLQHLLESIVNKGDVSGLEHDRPKDLVLSPSDITPLLKPLALLLSPPPYSSADVDDAERLGGSPYDEDTASLCRDAWFNIAVHGISLSSNEGQQFRNELRLFAKYSPSLVPENQTEILESDIELNTILRRGMTPQRVAEQKRLLIVDLPSQESDIKRLNYPKVVFLNAALLIETLRASSGDCTQTLTYFLDSSVNASEINSCMDAIVDKAVEIYLTRTLSGRNKDFSAPCLSKQLAEVFVACCHRIRSVQKVAIACADKIVSKCPSALCGRSSLFTLLDLLTVMWSSCLEGELDEFGWKSNFVSPRGLVRVDLSDNYEFRKCTLDTFYERSKNWVTSVMTIAPLDVKGLLQTYLSEYDDDGAYGHIALGRSFALEMASLIPSKDHRLSSIDKYGVSLVNVASDFIAQYTTRQEYRYSELSRPGGPVGKSNRISRSTLIYSQPDVRAAVREVEAVLAGLLSKTRQAEAIPPDELREALRKAAALLCSGSDAEPSIVHYLVNIPFEIFTKESIKFGISLWLGVINENPRTESRILAEIAEAWERTIKRKKGIFDPSFDHPDPFYTNIQLLPSDKPLLLQKQQKAHDVISPHFRILQFFESHFSATRLGSPQIQRIFCRLISATLIGLQGTRAHPLAREVHFHIICFGLKILRYATTQTAVSRWRLKDQILSAALSWFKNRPKFSFGGNRLQMKAEDNVLNDVDLALKSVSNIGSIVLGALKPLKSKQDLVHILLDNERGRLKVWLFPLDHERKSYISGFGGGRSLYEDVSPFLSLAWTESPSLAIQIAARFPSEKIQNEVRSLLLDSPEAAVDEPESLQLLLGYALPTDVTFQLKYLLYWKPVVPIEALTYFLPAYGNHPYILQYAMRTLESHPIDVRFYFVPQLVQALRYDALGYVERYIYETAKLSQIFSHQVIWNMKANAYKDEDSQVPDSIKPTLDRFMKLLVSSFSENEREFYEREFAFFNEITGISGKLRPYIKKSKQEKKQKIEEELRQIKVDVGVYLPCNPDGIVVGIDRKSGKPLQSHAKAPYMATFRIRKTRDREPDIHKIADQHAESTVGAVFQSSSSTSREREAYEVWQSAIFKVGDDCRQDVLALQLIAAFRSIFADVGLDVWVFPYRVTATAPGCGVVDVLPNSISRDMLGREAVNGLYDYFVSKYGGEESIRFQEARTNFVKSMASYSVISYLLQFKDRHNGNIMIDDAGHIIHIDFGFCFDIAPGGVRFERAPFKLTSEMVAVMGGSSGQHSGSGSSSSANNGSSYNSGGGLSLPGSHHGNNPTATQPYRWFESLTIKAFLASRPHAAKISHIVMVMLDSGLPCFKPDTLKNLRDRFVLDKNEREAAEYMRQLIRSSYQAVSTKGYDQFQLMTNGIPY